MVWDDLRVFLAVHRLGGHKRAGRLLGVDPTTVGRRIAALERALGTGLFLRTPERLQTSPAGLALVPHAERMEADALEAERKLLGGDRRVEGTLRVTAPDGFAHYLLLPALADLRREHPALSIDLRADTRVLDLSRREADVAVRLVRPREPALRARHLGQMSFSLFASDDYLARRGFPRTPAALAPHDFVGFDPGLEGLPQVRWLRQLLPEPRYVVRANTTTAQALACAEGHGVALLPTFVGSREPRLRPLLPRLVGPKRDLWAVTHTDLRRNTRASTFLAWLVRAVGAALE